MKIDGNGWKGYALAFMTALVLGGGVGTYTGKAAANEVRLEMQGEIEKLEIKLENRMKKAEDDLVANQLRIVEGLTELKVDVRYIRETLNKIK